LRDLEAAGWLRVVERPRQERDGSYRARTAVRVFTTKALAILGLRLTGAAADEQLADRRIGARLARVAGIRGREHARPSVATPPAAVRIAATVAPSAPRAGPSEEGRAAVASIAALLGIRRR
jgi:hypothetical protein